MIRVRAAVPAGRGDILAAERAIVIADLGHESLEVRLIRGEVGRRVADPDRVVRDIRARQQFPLTVRAAVDIEAYPAALMLVGQGHVVPVVVIDPAPRRDLADPADIEDELPLADEQRLAAARPFLGRGARAKRVPPFFVLIRAEIV